MALKLLWSEQAKAGLRAILDHIAEFDEGAALRLKARIDDVIVPVLEHPYLFRSGRVAGTREIVVHPNYMVVYSVAADAIVVLAVLHTRRDYP